MDAAASGHSNVATLLLKFRADPTQANFEGCTALQYAAHKGHADVVRILVDAAREAQRAREEAEAREKQLGQEDKARAAHFWQQARQEELRQQARKAEVRTEQLRQEAEAREMQAQMQAQVQAHVQARVQALHAELLRHAPRAVEEQDMQPPSS